MAVTIQIFTLFLGVVIVKSHPLSSGDQKDNYIHQENFSDFLEGIISELGALFKNTENPHILENRILPQLFGGVGFFNSGIFDKAGLEKDGSIKPINFNGGTGQGGNNVPSLNSGTGSVEGSNGQGGNNIEANVPDSNDANKVNNAVTDAPTSDINSHVNDVLSTDNVIETAKTNEPINVSNGNEVLDNQEGKNINVNEELNTAAKELIEQNGPKERKERNATGLEKIVTALNDKNILKGILMIDPAIKINDTDSDINKYTDAIVFPDVNNPVQIYIPGNSGAGNPGQTYDSGNSEANKQGQNGEHGISGPTNPGHVELHGNAGANNPGQVHTTVNAGSVNSDRVDGISGNSGLNSPEQIYVPGKPGNYGINTPTQVYIPGNSGASNTNQVYVLGNSGANNLGQINVPSNLGTNNPGQIYVLGNSGANNPSQVNVQANSGTHNPGHVYLLGNSAYNSPSQVNVPGNSGSNYPGQVYVLGNSGNTNPNQVNIPGNSGTNKPGQVYILGNSGVNNPGQVTVPGNSGQIYLSNNAPGSSVPTTNGGYYIIKLNNGQTILIPTSNKPDNGLNSQTNNGQTYVPVNYNPNVSMPNGPGYVVLGNTSTGNSVTSGNNGNAMTNRPTNNVPLLISYKDKDGDRESTEDERASKVD